MSDRGVGGAGLGKLLRGAIGGSEDWAQREGWVRWPIPSASKEEQSARGYSVQKHGLEVTVECRAALGRSKPHFARSKTNIGADSTT